MAYGIEIKNSTGEVVLDGNTSVFTEVSSGVVSVATDDERCYKGNIYVPPNYTNTIIAYKLPAGKWLSLWGDKVYAHKSTGTASVAYKIFAQASQASFSGDPYGLVMYDALGNLVFDSGRKIFNVLSNHVFTSTQYATTAFYNAGNQWLIPSVAGYRGGYFGTYRYGKRNVLMQSTYILQNSSGSVSTMIDEMHTVGTTGSTGIFTSPTCSALRIVIA